MGKVRSRKETGRLYLDFMYAGHRCREQTALADTPANRKRVEALLQKVEAKILLGDFNYAEYFPDSGNLKKIEQKIPGSQAMSTHGNTETPRFPDFADQWFLESKIQWRNSHVR
ncbi:MAG: Arm DNA-binding domain-containing protein, partial [Marinobacter sp.]